MTDLALGFGLVLVIEGLLWALYPNLAQRLLKELAGAPQTVVRVTAWVMVGLGIGLVWLARG